MSTKQDEVKLTPCCESPFIQVTDKGTGDKWFKCSECGNEIPADSLTPSERARAEDAVTELNGAGLLWSEDNNAFAKATEIVLVALRAEREAIKDLLGRLPENSQVADCLAAIDGDTHLMEEQQ